MPIVTTRRTTKTKTLPPWHNVCESLSEDEKHEIIEFFVSKVGQPGTFQKFCTTAFKCKVWNSNVGQLVRQQLKATFSYWAPEYADLAIDILIKRDARPSVKENLDLLYQGVALDLLADCQGNVEESVKLAVSIDFSDLIDGHDLLQRLFILTGSCLYYVNGTKFAEELRLKQSSESESIPIVGTTVVDTKQFSRPAVKAAASPVPSLDPDSVAYTSDQNFIDEFVTKLASLDIESELWDKVEVALERVMASVDQRNEQLSVRRQATNKRNEILSLLVTTLSILSSSVDTDYFDNASESVEIMEGLQLHVQEHLPVNQVVELLQSLLLLNAKIDEHQIAGGKQKRVLADEVDQFLGEWSEHWKAYLGNVQTEPHTPEDRAVDVRVGDHPADQTKSADIEVIDDVNVFEIVHDEKTDQEPDDLPIAAVVAEEVVSVEDVNETIVIEALFDDAVTAKLNVADQFTKEQINESELVPTTIITSKGDDSDTIDENETNADVGQVNVPESEFPSQQVITTTLTELFRSGRVRAGANYASRVGVCPTAFGDSTIVDLLIAGPALSGPTASLNETIKTGLEAISLSEPVINNPVVRTLLWTSLIVPTLIGRSDVRHFARPLLAKFEPIDGNLRALTRQISDFVLRTNVINKSDFAKSSGELKHQRMKELGIEALKLKNKFRTKVIKYAAGSRMIQSSVTGNGVLGLVLDAVTNNTEAPISRADKIVGRSVLSFTTDEWLDELWGRYKRLTDREIEGGPREDCRKLISEAEVVIRDWKSLRLNVNPDQSNELIIKLKGSILLRPNGLIVQSSDKSDSAIEELVKLIWDQVLLLISGDDNSGNDFESVFVTQDECLIEYCNRHNLQIPLSTSEIVAILTQMVDDRSVDEYDLHKTITFLDNITAIDAQSAANLTGRLDQNIEQYKTTLVTECIHLIAIAGTAKAIDQLSEPEFVEIVNELSWVREEIERSGTISTITATYRISPCRERLELSDRKFREQLTNHVTYKTLPSNLKKIVDHAMDEKNYASVYEMLQSGDPDVVSAKRDNEEWHLIGFHNFLNTIRPDILDSLDRKTINGGTIEGIQFPRLANEIVDRRLAVLTSWKTLKRNIEFTKDPVDDINVILDFLGFDNPKIAVVSDGVNRTRSVQFNVSADRTTCPNPNFGSRLATSGQAKYQIHGSWQVQDVGSVVFRIPDAPSVLFYFNVLKKDKRNQLIRISRDRRTTPIVIDTSLIIYLLTLNPNEVRKAFFDCVTPYSPQNPYHVQGIVPVEMFYGRTEAIKSIQRGDVSLVYGGRQLGKTALLQRVRDLQSNFDHQKAVYIDLKHEGVGITVKIDDFDRLIAEKLRSAGIPRLQATNWDRHLLKWLNDGQVDNREVTLLLDEADVFLDQDDVLGFRYTQKFRQLMMESNRRFKVVFAGLHNVLRMTTSPNHPFGQLGQPVCVGPLLERLDAIEARELIRYPLQSVGIQISDELVTEILAQTNWYPSLIQMYCHTLVDNKLMVSSSLPIEVVHTDLKSVYDRNLRVDIANKFALTLGLDVRYKYLTLVIAFLSIDTIKLLDGLDIHDIRTESQHHWGDHYDEQLGGNRLGNLLDELVGLGVLRKKNGKYALRTANITALLGGLQQIEHELSTFAETAHELKVREDYYIDEATEELDPLARWQYRNLANFDTKVVIGVMASGISKVEHLLPQRTGYGSSRTVVRPITATNLREFRRELDSLSIADVDRTLLVIPQTIFWDDSWVTAACEKAERVNVSTKQGLGRLQVLFVGTSQHELSSGYQCNEKSEWIAPTKYGLEFISSVPDAAAKISRNSAKPWSTWLGLAHIQDDVDPTMILASEFELEADTLTTLMLSTEAIQILRGSKVHRLGLLVESDGEVRAHPVLDELLALSLPA